MWIKHNRFSNTALFNLCLKNVSSLGYILNSPEDRVSREGEAWLRDAQTDPGFAEQHVYDVIVVGSGAGGATAAYTLAESQQDVLLIEEGRRFQADAIGATSFDALRSLWRNFGMQICYGQSLIPIIQGRVLGGSTVISGSIMHPFQQHIWEEWCALDPGIGNHLDFETITQCGAELLDTIHYRPGDNEHYRHSPVRKRLEDHGFSVHAMNRFAAGCKRSENCIIGCRTGGKSSVDRTLLQRFQDKGGTILTQTRLECFDKNNGLITLRVVDDQSRPRRFQCRKLVLSCGVIETAKVLHRSGFRHSRLGKGFTCNISSSIALYYRDNKQHLEGLPMGLEAVYGDAKFSTQSVPLELMVSRLGLTPDEIRDIEPQRLSAWAISIRSGQRGMINFGPMNSLFRVKYSPDIEDMKKLRHVTAELMTVLTGMEGARILPQINGFDRSIHGGQHIDESRMSLKPGDYPLGMSHIFGGCCMSSDPDSGIVDPDGQVKDIPNVYVLDASIFPLPTGVNPQLSIMSVVRKLSKTIVKVP